MKTAFSVLSIFIVVFIVLLFNFKAISRAGEISGIVGGMLAKCPGKPNCACSEYRDDASHYIDPLIIPQNIPFDTFSLLKTIIQEMGGTVQIEKNNYLAATFTSAIFKFVDDLEIRIDSTQKLIHIRSASRVVYTDLGVNKKRTELLKKLFNKKVSEAGRSMQPAS